MPTLHRDYADLVATPSAPASPTGSAIKLSGKTGGGLRYQTASDDFDLSTPHYPVAFSILTIGTVKRVTDRKTTAYYAATNALRLGFFENTTEPEISDYTEYLWDATLEAGEYELKLFTERTADRAGLGIYVDNNLLETFSLYNGSYVAADEYYLNFRLPKSRTYTFMFRTGPRSISANLAIFIKASARRIGA